MSDTSPYAHLVDPDWYEANGYPHESWRELRAGSPLHWVERDAGDSFWAITKQAEIADIGRRPEEFSNAVPVVRDQAVAESPNQLPAVLIQLDPPIHAKYRQLVSRRMTPRKVAAFHDEIEKIAVEILRDLEQHESTGCDFVETVAAPLPIAVIGWLLGVPREPDWREALHTGPTSILPAPRTPSSSDDPETRAGHRHGSAMPWPSCSSTSATLVAKSG